LPEISPLVFYCKKQRPLADDLIARVQGNHFIGRADTSAVTRIAKSASEEQAVIAVKRSQRKVIVFTSLLAVLTLTSAVLMALAPAPLVQDAASSLFAIDTPRSLDVIFETKVPVVPQRWNYIYIHHTQSASGDALSLAQTSAGFGDHFLIGNGDGAVDGEIQIGQRWNQQQSATPPAGAQKIDSHCISVCVVGDFDRTVPTSTQLRRLAQLVGTLQGQLHIQRDSVLLIDHRNSAAGAGKYFPAAAFRNQLLP